MANSDKQPLLPTHVNHSSTHRLSTPQISFPSSSTSALDPSPSDDQNNLSSARSARKTSRSIGGGHSGIWKRNDLPKVTRECLWAEIKCYGSYILPTFLVFGVLVILGSLVFVGSKRGWFG